MEYAVAVYQITYRANEMKDVFKDEQKRFNFANTLQQMALTI
jgi:hypothetical protein